MTMAYRPAFITVCGLLLALSLAGCSRGDKPAAPDAQSPAASDTLAAAEKQVPVDQLYNKAAQMMDEGNFLLAARAFEDVDREYPYSQWATRAQMMSAFGYYKALRYDEAILSLDRFIELHPGDGNIAYAYYLRALCYYEQISDVRRDQRMTQLALENLRQVRDRFPDSRYSRDAALKIDLTMDHLAGKEMEIGRYYLLRKHYQAGINRFQRVLTEYQTTTHTPEALYRLAESYMALGLVDEAKRNAAILGHNFPESSWYKDAYRLFNGDDSASDATPEKRGIYDRTIGKIF